MIIEISEYEDMLKSIGNDYFVTNIEYVNDIAEWARENGLDLSEPYQPFKLVAEGEKQLTLTAQSEIQERNLADVVKALSVRWALKDTRTDMDAKLDSIKKRLAFCFFKEYARTVPGSGGDEILEDEWAMGEMEREGFFDE